jgi:outer membrane lipoprotein-sorting protein
MNGLIVLTLICQLFQTGKVYPGYHPVEDVASFRKMFAESSAAVESVSGDFIQEKSMSALTEKITSRGKLWFKKGNKVRMDYFTPFIYSMVINGDKMLIRDDQKENRINVKSNKIFQQVNKIMVQCMQGSALQSKDFTNKVFENDKQYLIELKPVDKNIKEFFEAIILVADKKDSSLKSLELLEPSGDKTIITLVNKVVNAEFADEVFAF